MLEKCSFLHRIQVMLRDLYYRFGALFKMLRMGRDNFLKE